MARGGVAREVAELRRYAARYEGTGVPDRVAYAAQLRQICDLSDALLLQADLPRYVSRALVRHGGDNMRAAMARWGVLALASWTDEELLEVPQIGPAGLQAIRRAMRRLAPPAPLPVWVWEE
jgi:hypothetical protein